MKTFFGTLCLCVFCCNSLFAQSINVQTELRNGNGLPLRGFHSLTFRFADSKGNVLPDWTYAEDVILANGSLVVKLGGNGGQPFPIDKVQTYHLEILENGTVLDHIALNGTTPTEPSVSKVTAMLGAKVMLSDVDQGSATDAQVLTWSRSENSWRPRAPQQGSGAGTSGVNTLNGVKGDLTIAVNAPLRVTQTTGKMTIDIDNGNQQTVNVPVGTIVAFFGSENRVTDGWLLCDGRSFDSTIYTQLRDILADLNLPNSKTPDLRGQFLRGTDQTAQGRGNNDPEYGARNGTGQKIGSGQPDAYQTHSHRITVMVGGGDKQNYIGSPSSYSSNGAFNTEAAGTSTETRPKNLYVNWIIRAK